MTTDRLAEIEKRAIGMSHHVAELIAALKEANQELSLRTAELGDFKKVWGNADMLHVNLLRHPVLSRNQLLHLAGTSENELDALRAISKGGDAGMFTEPVPMNRPGESSILIRGEDWDSRKAALGLTCLHPSHLLVGTENGWICCECWAEDSQSELDRLRAENSELLADKERLDWLGKYCCAPVSTLKGHKDVDYYKATDFRAAIDAARNSV